MKITEKFAADGTPLSSENCRVLLPFSPENMQTMQFSIIKINNTIAAVIIRIERSTFKIESSTK